MEQTTIDITVGDVRKSSDRFTDTGNCHLCNAVKRVMNKKGITVGAGTIKYQDQYIGVVYPFYEFEHYNTDKSFVHSNPSLPDTHIIRTLQFKPTT